jgi:hypothetical protein
VLGDEPGLWSLQKVECSKGHGGHRSGMVEGVCDEMWEVKSKHTPIDDTPGLVGVGAIADDLGVIIKAEMKRRCPEEPHSAMNRVFGLCKR